MKTFKSNQITAEDRNMTNLNDAQLNQVAGGTSEIAQVQASRAQRSSKNPDSAIDYGNMQFADQQQFGVS